MHQPQLTSGLVSVNPLRQLILYDEHTGCKTAPSSFALCLLAIIFSSFIGVSTVSHLISFGTLGWVLSEPCDLLYLNYRSCSLGFTAAICSSLQYLCAEAITLQNLSPFFFSTTLLAICPIDCALFQHVVATISSMITSLWYPPFSSKDLLGWGKFAPVHATSDWLCNNCFRIINLFTSAQSTKHIVKNNLYKHSSLFSDRLFRVPAF